MSNHQSRPELSGVNPEARRDTSAQAGRTAALAQAGTTPPTQNDPIGQSGLAAIASVEQVNKKSLRYSIIDGSAASITAGFGDGFQVLFAMFLNAGNIAIGLLAAMPQLAGSVAQLVSVNILDRVPARPADASHSGGGRRKSVIIPAVLVQMLSWLPIFFLPFIWKSSGPLLLVAAVTVYIFAGSMAVPAWNSLMGDLVDPDKRGRYFGRRNTIANLFAAGSALCAGIIMNYFAHINNEWLGFAIIFAVAFLARSVSAYFLNKMVEPAYVTHAKDRFTFWDFIRRSPKSNFGRFVFFVAFINLAVMFSGPFFTVYMKRDLHLSYFQIILSSQVAIGAQLVMMVFWGKLCDKFGNVKVITITGWASGIVPVIWLLSPNYYWILVFQVVSGVVWSGFNLAAANFIFDAVSPPKRARCVAYFALCNNTAVFCGALLGGLVANYVSTDLRFLAWHIATLVSSLQMIFLFSGLMRFLICSAFIAKIKEVRQVKDIQTWALVLRITRIEPLWGSLYDIFTGGGGEENNGIRPSRRE